MLEYAFYFFYVFHLGFHIVFCYRVDKAYKDLSMPKAHTHTRHAHQIYDHPAFEIYWYTLSQRLDYWPIYFSFNQKIKNEIKNIKTKDNSLKVSKSWIK
jgi:hypothetical protein